MSMTSDSRTCPKCAGPIPASALEGLCPRCLLQGVALPTEAGKPASKGAPPTLGELSLAFPNLELLEFIGQGGMGFVYKARQPKLNRFVALKILPQSLAADPSFAERFVREGRLLARLSHPQIVSVHDFGQANGFFFLLMEYVDGVNLRQVMKAGRMEPAKALAIVPKLCEALQYAHSEGVLHRDIKPENILLDTRGRVKIADFGIAKLLVEAAGEPELTTGGAALGTPHYMAPEQLERPDQVDHRADVYSLGVVFYEMLTGELPIGRFAPPSEKSPVDPRLDDVVLRTLEKERERRTQSAGEVKTQVENVASGDPQPSAPPQNPSAPAETSSRRRKMTVAGTLVAALLLLIGLVIFLKSGSNESPGNQPNAGKVSKTILLARATNQFVGDSRELQSVVLWCDTTLEPGETLLAMVRLADGSLSEARTLLLTRCSPGQIKTSTSFSWFFGPPYNAGFGESAADLAVAQIKARTSDKPLVLTTGESLEVFSVTNEAGAALTGYVQFVHSPSERTATNSPSATNSHAVVHVRNHNPYVRSIDYSAVVPSGYTLRATASMGEASTFFAPSARPAGSKASSSVGSAEYHSSWFPPPVHGSLRVDPARIRAQQDAIAEQLQKLIKRGALHVTLGQPFEVFAITNDNGEVFQGFLELSDSPVASKPAPAALIRTPVPEKSVESKRKSTASKFPGLDLTTGLPVQSQKPGAVQSRIDPATGLPVAKGNGASGRVDPTTGLVASANRSPQEAVISNAPVDPLHEARELANKGEHERALQCYLSYYERSRSSSTTRPPLVSALSDWVALGQKYPKARQALTGIQERGLQAFYQGQGSLELFNELAQVNTALHQDAKTLALFKALAQADPLLSRQCYFYAEELLVSRGEYDLCVKFLSNVQQRFESLVVTYRAGQRRISSYLSPQYPVGGTTNTWIKIRNDSNDRFVHQICRWTEILVATGSPDEGARLCASALAVLDDPRLKSGVEDARSRVGKVRAAPPAPSLEKMIIAAPRPVNTNVVALSVAVERWAPDLAQGQKPDFLELLKETRALDADGRYEEALQRHIWYHNHSLELDPDQRGVRISFLRDWVELGRRYTKARDALLEIRDWKTRKLLDGTGNAQAFKDVAAINEHYGNQDATLSLFKSVHKRDPALGRTCYDSAESLLVTNREYELCLSSLGDYEQRFSTLRQQWETGRKWENDMSEKLKTIPNRSGGPSLVPPPFYDNFFVERTRRLIEILAGTGHTSEAEQIQAQAVAALDDARLRSAVADAKRRIGD